MAGRFGVRFGEAPGLPGVPSDKGGGGAPGLFGARAGGGGAPGLLGVREADGGGVALMRRNNSALVTNSWVDELTGPALAGASPLAPPDAGGLLRSDPPFIPHLARRQIVAHQGRECIGIANARRRIASRADTERAPARENPRQ